MNSWLQEFAYRIDLTIWPFMLAGSSAIVIALITVSFHAIRAAIANPVHALRYE
jgi:putative ABC transport system permease protein